MNNNLDKQIKNLVKKGELKIGYVEIKGGMKYYGNK